MAFSSRALIRPQSSPSYQRGQREVLRRFEVPTVAGLGTFWRTGAGEKDLIEFDAEHRELSRTPGQFPHAKVEEGMLTD